MTNEVREWLISLACLVVMVIVSFVQWRFALPMGTIGIIDVGGAFGLAAMIGVGLFKGGIVLVAGALIMMLTETADWILALTLLVVALAIAAVVGWRMPLDIHMSASQGITLGLIVGLVYLLTRLVLTVLYAYLLTSNWTVSFGFGKIALAPVLLAALLYAAIVPLAGLGVRHFTEHLSSGGPTKPTGSVEINLSADKDKQQKK